MSVQEVASRYCPSLQRCVVVASTAGGSAEWKAVRDAGILPADAAFFLFGHAIQWMISEENDLDRHELASLRRFGLDDRADSYVANRLEYDRRHERGRQFFHGPPDERLADRLRSSWVDRHFMTEFSEPPHGSTHFEVGAGRELSGLIVAEPP